MHGHRTASHSSDDVSGAKAPMRRSAAIPNDRGGARASASLRRTYKYRLYPTAAQERELERQLGVCCDLYNAALEQRQRMWRDHGVSVGFREQSAQLTEARRELTALAGMNALAQHEVLHKAIADRHEVVAIEDLNVRAMSQSARATVMTPGRNVQAKAGLSRAIADAAWGDLRELLAYKLEQRGGEVIAVSVAYTSQVCAERGQVDARDRRTRASFVCRACGHGDHADVNAARVIAQRGATRLNGARKRRVEGSPLGGPMTPNYDSRRAPARVSARGRDCDDYLLPSRAK